jgi:hypothetical protein
MNIFISYTTINNEVNFDLLIKLSVKLEIFGRIFIDMIHNDSIDKQSRVVEELEVSNLLILIKTESSLNSEWVKFELDSAKKMDIPIIEFSCSEISNMTIHEIKNRLKDYQNENPATNNALDVHTPYRSSVASA